MLSDFKARKGAWTNKQALQLGLKIIDILNVPTLDIQIENNLVRPYTYSHFDLVTNYSHYGQALAHPFGANFNELIIIGRYQPINKLRIQAKAIFVKLGLDTDIANDSTGNYGGNIFKPYNTVSKYHPIGNTISQGLTTNVANLSIALTYMLKHNLFIDLEIINRKSMNSVSTNKTILFNIGLRMNLARRVLDI